MLRSVYHQFPAMAAGDRACHRQSQTGTAGAARAAVVEPDEAVEDTLPLLFRDSGTVVAHQQLDLAIVAPQLEPNLPRGVTGSVVGQIADQLGKRLGSPRTTAGLTISALTTTELCRASNSASAMTT
jgi:hypothetical protein